MVCERYPMPLAWVRVTRCRCAGASSGEVVFGVNREVGRHWLRKLGIPRVVSSVAGPDSEVRSQPDRARPWGMRPHGGRSCRFCHWSSESEPCEANCGRLPFVWRLAPHTLFRNQTAQASPYPPWDDRAPSVALHSPLVGSRRSFEGKARTESNQNPPSFGLRSHVPPPRS